MLLKKDSGFFLLFFNLKASGGEVTGHKLHVQYHSDSQSRQREVVESGR